MAHWPTFPSPFTVSSYGDGFEPKTVRELDMMKLSATIRRKKNWFSKMKNPKIVAKWKEEAESMYCTQNQVAYVLKELEYYADLRVPELGIEVSDIDGVWHSDSLVPESVKQELLVGVSLLEDIPEAKRDWHPDSNFQVWDLVHPSLYPLAYGVSRYLKFGETRPSLKFVGGGRIFPAPSQDNRKDDAEYAMSKKFSWLPSEFIIRKDGTVKIDSYINNLHPIHHKDMYLTLEKIFERLVPLFDKVLNDQVHRRPNRIKVESLDWYGGVEYTGDTDDPNNDDLYENWLAAREVVPPDAPEDFIPFPAPDKPITIVGAQVQVIVKMANIMLSPQNPSYPGGVWHVEGMLNENIVASGIYYYDINNVTDSELEFRQQICEPPYEQDDVRGVSDVFGLHDDDPLNQVLGSVSTHQNRCLAFPNTYQHCVSPFELVDRSKPGHRKILVFFLVNPGSRAPSTLAVPPQQLDWYTEEVCKVSPFSTLPPEIVQHILSFLEWPLNFQRACLLRQELMHERKFFVSANTEQHFARPFSLCEH